MNIGAMLRRILVSSFCFMWVSGTVLAANITAAQKAKEAIKFADDVYVSLSVFITSIIATAIFTWTVAKYDNKKVAEITALNNAVQKFLDDKDNLYCKFKPDCEENK